MSVVLQLFIGLLFGSGLVVAGMSNPQKVLNFLNLSAISTGGWDPSLAFVLGGAVIVTFIGYGLVLKRERPLFDTEFHLPRARSINAPVIVGPAIFGVGWGLVGLCPGPAFTALGNGSPRAAIFMIMMLAGMIVARLLALKQIGATAPATRS